MRDSFIQRLFSQALEAKNSRSTLVHSLTVCISLLDPKKYLMAGMGRGQQIPDSLVTTNPEVIDGMLQRLGQYYMIIFFAILLLLIYKYQSTMLVMCIINLFAFKEHLKWNFKMRATMLALLRQQTLFYFENVLCR